MKNAISTNRLRKSFGKQLVLDDVCLEVPQGSVFALLGENGAGKSTLIRGLMGYHRFDAGSATVLGLNPQSNTMELRRKVGFVADSPGLYEWMTVAETGWYASGFYSGDFLQRYDQLIRSFGLRPDAKISELSKGMRAKVTLSVTMAFQPQLLILDEPTSGLDPHVRRTFLESMIDMAAAGQTVFVSSHQIHEVERVADWVAILHKGRIAVAAPLEELKNESHVVSFTLQDALLALPQELTEHNVINRRQSGRTVDCLIHGPCDVLVSAIRNHPNIMDVKAIRPNLEELFLGFTQSLERKATPLVPVVASASDPSDSSVA